MRIICLIGVILWSMPICTKNVRNVVDFGADKTGKTYATDQIQRAIDACLPGDTLLFPQGVFLLHNGLNLKSDITVIISPEALIRANTSHVWINNRSHILNSERVKNVTITGGGTIDGGGLVYPRGDYDRPRPGRGIRFAQSENITITSLTVRNIPNFAVDLLKTNNVILDSLVIRGRGFAGLKGSSDGLDIESCSNVLITNCDIEVGDDALCLKSYDNVPCHKIRIYNCTLASTCNAFKIGTELRADVYDVIADGIIVNKHSNPGEGNPISTGDCISAIALESNDGFYVHDIICRNFIINSCYNPIYIELQNRKANPSGKETSRLENILIENVNCFETTIQPVIFNWQPGSPNKIKNVILRNVTVHNYGTEPGADLTPMNGSYPDANKNGDANAYGIWARGLDGLKLQNCKFFDDGKSNRKKFIFDSSTRNIDLDE